MIDLTEMQKYIKGDLVYIVKDLGGGRTHFQSDCQAIVIQSYDDAYGVTYGGRDISSYTLYIKGRGKVSWYQEYQLKLIEKNRLDILEKWIDEADQEDDLKSDLEWIFKNGKDVLKDTHRSTVAALAQCFGLTDLWGSRGEGFTYYHNAISTIDMARPFLEAGDKAGWLKHCKNWRTTWD